MLGGEPTLHPHFTAFVLHLLERHFDVNVCVLSATLRDRTSSDPVG
jgi:hypothetical protein